MIEFVIEKEGDQFVLYSIVPTNFGGPAKNWIAESSDREVLENLINHFKQKGFW